MPETLRYLIKMLVSEPNHAGAIIIHLDLLPTTFVDPGNWEWIAESRATLWMPARANWRNFRNKWYGVTESQFASPEFPFLSLEPLPASLDPSISSSSP